MTHSGHSCTAQGNLTDFPPAAVNHTVNCTYTGFITALFTGAPLLGFVAPSAAGEFILWTGVFTSTGCEVTAVDQSTPILPFSDPLAAGLSCAELQSAIPGAPGFDCTQDPVQADVVSSRVITVDAPPQGLNVGDDPTVILSGGAECEPAPPSSP